MSALLEVSHRIASELLCDAKDYSEHAEHSDIEVDDVRLAIHLGENRYNGLDPRQEVINKVVKTINNKDLYNSLDKVIKYFAHSLTRSKTYSLAHFI